MIGRSVYLILFFIGILNVNGQNIDEELFLEKLNTYRKINGLSELLFSDDCKIESIKHTDYLIEINKDGNKIDTIVINGGTSQLLEIAYILKHSNNGLYENVCIVDYSNNNLSDKIFHAWVNSTEHNKILLEKNVKFFAITIKSFTVDLNVIYCGVYMKKNKKIVIATLNMI